MRGFQKPFRSARMFLLARSAAGTCLKPRAEGSQFYSGFDKYEFHGKMNSGAGIGVGIGQTQGNHAAKESPDNQDYAKRR